MLRLDGDEREYCVCRKCDHAGQETVGNAHGKVPVFDVGDSLLLGVGDKWVNCQFLQSCGVLIIALLGRNCSLGVLG